MNSGYYIEYAESSNLKLTITSAEVKYDRFPASDELFEFYLTGKAALLESCLTLLKKSLALLLTV